MLQLNEVDVHVIMSHMVQLAWILLSFNCTPTTYVLFSPFTLVLKFQVLSAIPIFWSPFLGISLVFMLVYVWSREFPNANVNIYGLVALKVCRLVYIHIAIGCFYFVMYLQLLILNVWCMQFLYIVIAGILSTLGDACFGRHFWFPNYAGSAGNHCWTSVLLLDCVASIGRWKEHITNSEMGVSLLQYFFVLLRCKVSIHAPQELS